MAPEFCAQGHEVLVVARSEPGQAQAERLQGVRYFRVRGSDTGRSRVTNYTSGLFAAVRASSHMPEADVYITNDVFSPWIMAGRGRAERTLVAVGRTPKQHFRWYSEKLNFAVPTRAIQNALAIIAPKLVRKTAVLPYAIDTDIFSPKEISSPSHNDRFLFVGRIHPEKGLDLLISAFEKLLEYYPHIQLVIAGPSEGSEGGGGSAYLKRLQAMSAHLPIEWLNPIYRPSDLASLYRSCAWFVYPSVAEQGETFGVAPLEAMACGCTPIVSKLPCFEDFINSPLNGFIFDHHSRDPATALALAMREAKQSASPTTQLRARATAEHFSIKVVAMRWLKHLEEMVVK